MSVYGSFHKLNESDMAKLSNMGWAHCQVGPNEWTWLKFSMPDQEKVIAHGGDDTWAADVKEARNYD